MVVGNWKMNGSAALLRDFAEAARHGAQACESVLCVPSVLLACAQSLLRGSALRWGAQDCAGHDLRASTGDVSAEMVAAQGTRYVIVGHSERRVRHRESDAEVAEKARRVCAAAMVPIVCIGESAADRDDNLTRNVLRRQLLALSRRVPGLTGVVLAYEPLWAIGSGDTASPGLIEETLEVIDHVLQFDAGASPGQVRLLYGGSVNARNAAAILACPRVDGVLVGGASLDPTEFFTICRAAGHRAAAAHAATVVAP